MPHTSQTGVMDFMKISGRVFNGLIHAFILRLWETKFKKTWIKLT